MKTLTTIPAHFNGKEIILDLPISLEPNTRLLVTVLNMAEDEHQKLVQEAMAASEETFGRIWDNDEDAIYDKL
jgi:hypothetical protein